MALSVRVFGRGIGEVSCKYHLNYSPATNAFRIWGLIYSSAIVTVIAQWASHMFADPRANFLYASAWLCASLWTPFFTADKKWTHIVASIVLCVCASCAIGAVVVERAWHHGVEERKRWYIAAPFSLLAGWTLTAAALSVGIAYEANDDAPDDDCKSERSGYNILNTQINDVNYSFAPLVISVVVFIVSVLLSDPILPLPVFWGVFHMIPSKPNFCGLGFLFLATCIAMIRVLMVV